jgi:hypothetical protein
MTEPTVSVRSGKLPRLQPGRGRLLALLVVSGLVAIVGISIWRIRNPNYLPDVGDPFDVAVERRPVYVADEDNAFVVYADPKRKRLKYPAGMATTDFSKLTWSKAGLDVRAFVQEKGDALEVWRQASERPEAIYHQPGELAIDTLLPIAQDISILGRLAGLEGSRREENGEMSAAWKWYRAMLRSSRHVGMHGVVVERMIGARMHEMAAVRILHWAADPRADIRFLHQALDDVVAADAMTAPLSRALKLEYLMSLRDLKELRVLVSDIPMPGGWNGWLEQLVAASGAKPQIQRVRLQATNDVERSQRAIRLLYANLLAQADKPASDRVAIAIAKPTIIFAADPSAPPAARAVAPEVLDQAIDRAAFAQAAVRPPPDLAPGGISLMNAPFDPKSLLAREPRRRAVLIVKLAAELFRREQGHAPATAAALSGRYLKKLPEGIKDDDPIPPELD